MRISPDFLPSLLGWYEQNKRDLPWRRDREPYHVWVSEIMLQQTRVEAVVGYYERFLTALPDIRALADAPEDKLLKLWEGLGYYSRARNLQKAARQILERHGGIFPRDAADIRALAGIGDYTAGAIGSICFEYPTAAVDGNVLRVVSRVTGSDAPIDKPETKKKIAADLSAVYPAGHCGDFTQSLMELGATVCTPRGAKCGGCPLADICAAKREDRVDALPVKGEKRARKIEERTVFFLECDGEVAICRRPPRGLLASMWQLPNTDGKLEVQSALADLDRARGRPRAHFHAHRVADDLLLPALCRQGARICLGKPRGAVRPLRAPHRVPPVCGVRCTASATHTAGASPRPTGLYRFFTNR